MIQIRPHFACWGILILIYGSHPLQLYCNTTMKFFSSSFSCALAVIYAAAVTASSYSNISSVSDFINLLDVSNATGAKIADTLQDLDTKKIRSLSTQGKNSLGCQVSRLVFGRDFLDSRSSNYDKRVEVNWSAACWLRPRCIIQPRSTEDVAKAMKIVTFLATKFSVRSGGNNPNPRYSSIDNEGILIEMINLNEITLSDDGSVAHLGPGNLFRSVYSRLAEAGRTVVGPRVGDVAVGGYFLGGGISFFSSMYGIGADNILNYEVVLPDATITNANATHNRELWWALKGSGTNYGIVTRYDVKTVPNSKVWFEAPLYSPEQSKLLPEAIRKYAAAAENDPHAAIIMYITPQSGLVGMVYGKPTPRPDVYKSFYDIPATQNYINSTTGTWADMYNAFTGVPPAAKRKMIATIACKWDAKVLEESFATYLDISARVADEFGAVLSYSSQPITTAAVKYGSENGGNPMGLEEISQNWFVSTIEYADSAHDEAALKAIQALGESVKRAAVSRGAHLSFLFMNDANYEQDVLSSYGPNNLARLRAMSRKYDPLQVFQSLQNDGFLLSKTKKRS
ncbi:hypothetical protein H105_00196 [Trichophyton soudanense CBS 452.61]|uniref:FAD-binding PCMH-type domain-containing protein n=1 Tax=Trichophyton soudanense CBS 452.61 TaxID=1215331 RepID=A0A022Y759_TRISD|nr:hypothetical protein H105_00196 [Trichophyton soudanense CBS 452.61]